MNRVVVIGVAVSLILNLVILEPECQHSFRIPLKIASHLCDLVDNCPC